MCVSERPGSISLLWETGGPDPPRLRGPLWAPGGPPWMPTGFWRRLSCNNRESRRLGPYTLEDAPWVYRWCFLSSHPSLRALLQGRAGFHPSRCPLSWDPYDECSVRPGGPESVPFSPLSVPPMATAWRYLRPWRECQWVSGGFSGRGSGWGQLCLLCHFPAHSQPPNNLPL